MGRAEVGGAYRSLAWLLTRAGLARELLVGGALGLGGDGSTLGASVVDAGDEVVASATDGVDDALVVALLDTVVGALVANDTSELVSFATGKACSRVDDAVVGAVFGDGVGIVEGVAAVMFCGGSVDIGDEDSEGDKVDGAGVGEDVESDHEVVCEGVDGGIVDGGDGVVGGADAGLNSKSNFGDFALASSVGATGVVMGSAVVLVVVEVVLVDVGVIVDVVDDSVVVVVVVVSGSLVVTGVELVDGSTEVDVVTSIVVSFVVVVTVVVVVLGSVVVLVVVDSVVVVLVGPAVVVVLEGLAVVVVVDGSVVVDMAVVGIGSVVVVVDDGGVVGCGAVVEVGLGDVGTSEVVDRIVVDRIVVVVMTGVVAASEVGACVVDVVVVEVDASVEGVDIDKEFATGG